MENDEIREETQEMAQLNFFKNEHNGFLGGLWKPLKTCVL